MQECRVAMETIRGEEKFDETYGFPLRDAIKNPMRLEPASLMKALVADTLNTSKIQTLAEASLVDCRYDDGVWTLKISLISINGLRNYMLYGVDSPLPNTG